MQNLGTDFYDLARSLGTQLVSFVTILICIVIALVRWKRHPKVSLLAALALILLILEALFFDFADFVLSRWLVFSVGVPVDTYYLVAGLTASVTMAIAFALLLIAIFIDRKPRAATS